MRKIMDEMGFAVVIVQGEVFHDVNPAAAAVIGYPREELMGTRFWEIVHPEYRDENKAVGFLHQSEKTAPECREIKIIRKDGREAWLLAIVSSTEIDGKPAATATLIETPARSAQKEAGSLTNADGCDFQHRPGRHRDGGLRHAHSAVQ
jgi:PAS domain S-box-containing protein